MPGRTTTTAAEATIVHQPDLIAAANTLQLLVGTATTAATAETIASNLPRQKIAIAVTNADCLLHQNAMRNVGTSRGRASCASMREQPAHSHQRSPSLGTRNGA